MQDEAEEISRWLTDAVDKAWSDYANGTPAPLLRASLFTGLTPELLDEILFDGQAHLGWALSGDGPAPEPNDRELCRLIIERSLWHPGAMVALRSSEFERAGVNSLTSSLKLSRRRPMASCRLIYSAALTPDWAILRLCPDVLALR